MALVSLVDARPFGGGLPMGIVGAIGMPESMDVGRWGTCEDVRKRWTFLPTFLTPSSLVAGGRGKLSLVREVLLEVEASFAVRCLLDPVSETDRRTGYGKGTGILSGGVSSKVGITGNVPWLCQGSCPHLWAEDSS